MYIWRRLQYRIQKLRHNMLHIGTSLAVMNLCKAHVHAIMNRCWKFLPLCYDIECIFSWHSITRNRATNESFTWFNSFLPRFSFKRSRTHAYFTSLSLLLAQKQSGKTKDIARNEVCHIFCIFVHNICTMRCSGGKTSRQRTVYSTYSP